MKKQSLLDELYHDRELTSNIDDISSQVDLVKCLFACARRLNLGYLLSVSLAEPAGCDVTVSTEGPVVGGVGSGVTGAND